MPPHWTRCYHPIHFFTHAHPRSHTPTPRLHQPRASPALHRLVCNPSTITTAASSWNQRLHHIRILRRGAATIFGMAAPIRKGAQRGITGNPGDASDFSSSSVSIGCGDTPPNLRQLRSSYRRFFFLHVLALVPTFAILVAALLGSLKVREFCHLQDSPRDAPHTSASPDSAFQSGYQKGRCRKILDAQLLLSTLALGVVGWLASYTSRKACLAFADRIIPQLFSPSRLLSRSPRFQLPTTENGPGRESVIVTVAIAMQALIGESLRVLSFYWACCILVTALYLYPIQEKYAHRPSTANLIDTAASITGPDWAWRLSFRDPRFFVAAWSSIAWALAEASFGAFQILHQVALYKPADVDPAAEMQWPDSDALQTDRAGVGQSGFSMLSGRGLESAPEPNPTSGRGNGKARRMSASRALEQARQRLVQPAGDLSAPSSYGAMGALDEAVEQVDEEAIATGDETDSQASASSFSSETISLLDQELEEEVERFLVAKERSEVEAVLGVPLPEIPVALCALWRIDAMLWSIGSSLLLSSSFTHAQGTLGHLSHDRFDLSPHFQLLPPFDGFGLTFFVLFVLHTIVSSLWATSLPFLGFATTTYASLLFGLAIMVAALARWGLLI
ncbi:hypothetical protein PANT_2c00047 [Moesziomyces antarcticus T-34]|uniref:Uncharacterized protein n=1 Tax=Pseudozyma antarctica (strain T-34) TaxID=1151754 RepID=M9LSQ0_PSEA3|nr:hypothetical protein PANT_2c00047 [Moesziomyces antarcticus T-34]